MHELSIALAIVDIASEKKESLGEGKIAAIHVKVGELSGVVPEALKSSFELARESSPVDNAELIIEVVPLAAYCPGCQSQRRVNFPELICPQCGTPTPDIVAGRELEVTALEIESP